MKLYGDVISPFVRMCLVTAHEAGIHKRVELVKTNVKPTEANSAIEKLSPIGKIPVLETDHHHALYDSRVIMEYFAHVAGNSSLIPDDGVKRFRILTLLALAQGMGDAAVVLRYEQTQRPPELQWQAWKDRAEGRISAGIREIENNWVDALADVSAGTVALACVLSYVDFRHPTLVWRDDNPVTSKFHTEFCSRGSMLAWPLQ
jgi:glutathione S-transferase